MANLVETIRDAVTEAYLETGAPVTVNQIAERLNWSENKVRRVINDECHGCPKGLACNQESRASFSRSYRGFQSGAHKVWVYFPTSWHLRDLINQLRKPTEVAS